MPEAGRVGDIAWAPTDSHGKNCCSHSVQGPAMSGSPNILINGMAALRVGDSGVHTACCGTNSWQAAQGAPGVFFNDIAAHRVKDLTTHCGGGGTLVVGSPNVIVGNMGGGGAPSPGTFNSPPVARYTGGFIVHYEGTDIPVSNRPYRITRADGRITEGVTNHLGRTAAIESDTAESLSLDILDWEET